MKTLYDGIRYHFHTIQFAQWLLRNPLFLSSPFHKMVVRKGVKLTRLKPVELMIELTNACNLACAMCPHPIMRRGRGVMTYELFREIIDQAAELKIRDIKIAGLGESLLDKDIANKITYAKKKMLRVKMFTNGMLLGRDRSLQLIESGVDEIFVSIDGGTQLVQERIRKGSSFSMIRDNLGDLQCILREKKKAGKKVPKVIVNVTYQEANKDERQLIMGNWGGLVDRVRFFPLHNWEVGEKAPQRASHPCHLPFFQMAICWDGRVALCCIDYECRHQLGDLTEGSISSIWQGKAAMEVRNFHLEYKSDRIALCRSCSLIPNWFFSGGL